jgi:Domain of unknown function (DUF397)
MINTGHLSHAWRKSSFSASGNCLEAANQDGSVLVRDSKPHIDRETLSFSSATWREFIGRLRRDVIS